MDAETIRVAVDRRKWDGLSRKASLISAVFGTPTTADDLVRLAVDRALLRTEDPPRTRGVGR